MKLKSHMKFKRFMSTVLSVMLVFALFSAVIPAASADSIAGTWNSYFRSQLSTDARVFYDAMVQMYNDGTFKTGTESLDLTKSGYLSQEKAAAYMNGDDPSAGSILADFGAARDAFWADYPSVFYVDFSNLSIRVTSDTSGSYHVYIGIGRTDNYFTQGFGSRNEVEAAINEYNAALSAIVEGAKQASPRVGQSVEAARVEYVHDALTKSISYKLENACKPENRGFIRTAYGALVKHEGVCEAYTRAFKAAMDALGIPCVMVNGVFLHNPDTPEVHIWNYVQLDGKWYGVDATMDDPYPPKNKAPQNANGLDGYESHEYLLRGDIAMGQKHVPVGIMSSANYEFTYPTLDVDDYGVEAITRDNGFSVSFKQDGITDDGTVAAGEFYISYRGMGCAAARQAGYWFLERFWLQDENGELYADDWHYILTDVYALDDHETYLHLSYAQVEFVEFAITEVAPGPYLEDPDTYMRYVGDPGNIGPQSGMIYNANSGYKAPPYPKTVTPVMNEKMYIKNIAYHVTVEYTDDLMRTSDHAEIGVDMEALAYNADRTRREIVGISQRAKIENIQWDGGRVVSFDFTPSEYYSDDTIFYKLYITGLVGISSGKAPVEITYGASHPTWFCGLRADGFNWHVFAQPTLIDNSDLSMSGWEMSDGSIPSELLASRLSLVASSTSPAQTEVMNDLIENTGANVLSSQTYNISLTLCKGCISKISDGQGLRIGLGFPAGYGPEDEGVTFKAYHFIKDADGNTVGVEEIPCIVTRYGLIIECYSFSPFAIAAVKGSSSTTARGVILSNTLGGSVSSPLGNMFSLSESGSASVNISADSGNVIETLTVDGKIIAEATGKASYTLNLSYNELAAVADNIVNVSFVAQSVHEEDVKNGETVQIPPVAELHEHTWGAYESDETGHYRTCTDCGAAEAKASHIGGTATCSERAKCTICGASYGSVAPNNHTGNIETDANGNTFCSDCKELVASGAFVSDPNHTHDFNIENSDDGSHWVECLCGARVAVEPHIFGEYTAHTNGHERECSKCGRKVTESHIPNADDLDCSTPTTCAVCGYTIDEARAHTWGLWVSDGDYHVAECLNENCDVEKREAHSGGTATCASPAVCEICYLEYGEKDANNHVGGTEVRDYEAQTDNSEGFSGNTYCLGCGKLLSDGEILDILSSEHEHKFAEKYDGAGHWKECACGVRLDGSYAEHYFDSYAETAEGHAHKCTECGYVTGFELHIPGDNNDCETAVYCMVCMYELSPAMTHNFDGILFSDAYGHWHVCTNPGCTQIDGKTAHSGGTATCSKLAVCGVCFAEYGEFDRENHVLTEHRGEIEATNGTDGYTGDIYCLDCGNLIVSGSVIQKLSAASANGNAANGQSNGTMIVIICAALIVTAAAVTVCSVLTVRRQKHAKKKH